MTTRLDVINRFCEESIIGFPREAEEDVSVRDIRRQHGFREALYYL